MRILLKLKHWQWFIAFIIPIIIQRILFFVSYSPPKTKMEFTEIYTFSFIGIELFMLVFILWIASVSIGLKSYLPGEIKMRQWKFSLTAIYPLVYTPFFFWIISSPRDSHSANPSENPALLLIPLHFLAMFCMLYNLYFTAKTLKTVELQRKVTIKEIWGEIVMFGFFLLSVWSIQPKINQLIKKPYNP